MFLKYHKDAITGKKWKIKDDTKTVDCKKNHEETRERSLQFSWVQGRPWLKYTDGLMFCTACKEEGATEKDSVFVKGSTVMRQDGIKYHEVSDRHKRAIEKKLAQTTPVHDTDDDDDDENEMAEDSFFFDNVL
jgi:hypothetical protein